MKLPNVYSEAVAFENFLKPKDYIFFTSKDHCPGHQLCMKPSPDYIFFSLNVQNFGVSNFRYLRHIFTVLSSSSYQNSIVNMFGFENYDWHMPVMLQEMQSLQLTCIKRSYFSCQCHWKFHMNWTSFKVSPVLKDHYFFVSKVTS